MVRISPHRIPTRRKRVQAALIHYAVRIPHAVWRALSLGFLHRKRLPGEVRKILAIRADGLGDLVMTVPTLVALRDLYPGAELVLLAARSSEVLLPHLPAVDRAIFLDLPWAQRSVRRLDLREARRVLRNIRKERFDLILDLRGDFRNILLMQCMGRAYKVGYGSSGLGFLLDREVPSGEDRHEVEHKLDSVRALGGDVASPRFDLRVMDEDRRAVSERLLSAGVKGAYAVLHPGAQWRGREWRPERYAELADRILRDLGLPVVLAGVPREAELGDGIVRRMAETPVEWVGRTSFGEYLALVEGASLFVGVDSGPMHLAAALGVRVVALFGPGDPAAVGPHGPRCAVVSEASRFPCSPCAQEICPHEGSSCMDAISVESVWTVARHAVAEPTHRARWARPDLARGQG